MSRYAVVVGSKEYRRTAYALCGHAADASRYRSGESDQWRDGTAELRRNYGSGFTDRATSLLLRQQQVRIIHLVGTAKHLHMEQINMECIVDAYISCCRV